jgi:hypothetical protein
MAMQFWRFIIIIMVSSAGSLAFGQAVDCNAIAEGVTISGDGKVTPNKLDKVTSRVERNSTSVWVTERLIPGLGSKLMGNGVSGPSVVIALDDQGRATHIIANKVSKAIPGFDGDGPGPGNYSVRYENGKCLATKTSDITQPKPAAEQQGNGVSQARREGTPQ